MLARHILVVIGLNVVVIVVNVSETGIGFVILATIVSERRATISTVTSLLTLKLAAEALNMSRNLTKKSGRLPNLRFS